MHLPFSYRPGSSVFHRLPAWLKLFGLLAFSCLVFASNYVLAVLPFALFAACAFARIHPASLLWGAKPIMLFALAIIIVQTIDPQNAGIATPQIEFLGLHIRQIHIPAINGEGFYKGLVAALRIIVVFAATGFLFAVTTMHELRLSLAALERKVKNIFSFGHAKKSGKDGRQGIEFFSLGISLMLMFIPRFFQVWETADLSCRARSCRSRLRRLIILVPLATEKMMEAAAETVLALEARGFGQTEGGHRQDD